MRKVLALCTVLAAALLLAACGGGGSSSSSTAGGSSEAEGGGGEATTAESSGKPIIVGAAIAESGLVSAYDMPGTNAAELAINDINAKGGLLGRQIKLIKADTRSEPAGAKTAAEKVIDQGAEMVIAPADYDFGSPAAQAADQAGLVSWSLGSGSPLWGPQGIGPLTYTPSVPGNTEGLVQAQFATKKLKAKTLAILNDTSLSYNVAMCGATKERFEEEGGKVVVDETFSGEESRFSSQVNAVKSANPDAIQICGYPPGAPTMIRQLRAAGIDAPVMLNTAMASFSAWVNSIPGLEDTYVTSYADIHGEDPNPEVNELLARYKKEFGETPSNGVFVDGYALIEAWAKAVEEAGTTEGEAVANALNEFSGFETIIGPMTFTPEIHITLDRPFQIDEVSNGKIKYVGSESAEPPPTSEEVFKE